LPVIGHFLRLAATALASRSLSILLHSGVTLLEGLKTLENLHANHYLRRRLASARLEVIEGGNLATALKDRFAYLPMLSAMVAVGESAGTLDEVLEETARFQEEQLQTSIRQFSAIIEPVILVVVGSIVGFVYIAFFMALFAAAGSSG
jgi:type IV pilus assembly protein PilC